MKSTLRTFEQLVTFIWAFSNKSIVGAFGDSEDLYHKDKDSGEDGGWFDGPGEGGWDSSAVGARQSIIKFAGVDTETEEEEREPREMVRQKTPHPKELKAKAHKLFGDRSPTKSADNTVTDNTVSFDAGLTDNGEFINGIQKKEVEAAMDQDQDEGIPQPDLEDEEDEETYKGELSFHSALPADAFASTHKVWHKWDSGRCRGCVVLSTSTTGRVSRPRLQTFPHYSCNSQFGKLPHNLNWSTAGAPALPYVSHPGCLYAKVPFQLTVSAVTNKE